MKETALVIMAAGIGSRFGGGIKQLAPVGPSGEIIMDYSIHDAIDVYKRQLQCRSPDFPVQDHLCRYLIPVMSSEGSQQTGSYVVTRPVTV